MHYDPVDNLVEKRTFCSQMNMNQPEPNPTHYIGYPAMPCMVVHVHGPTTIRGLVRGIGTVVDIFPQPRSWKLGQEILQTSDVDMIRDDWLQVGIDLQESLNAHVKEIDPHGCEVRNRTPI